MNRRRNAPARSEAGRRPRLGAAVLPLALVSAGLGLAMPLAAAPAAQAAGPAKQMEALGRGAVAVRSGSGTLVSWRLLGTDPQDVAFNVYRNGSKLNGAPITGATNYLDNGAAGGTYAVRAVVGGSEQPASTARSFGSGGYLDVPISPPSGSHHASDASVGDLNGDGELDFVLKWEPDNLKDNSQSGTTGLVYLDGITLDGDRLWRINLGRNIRAGAHYTQFQVYDYDGDGDAELAVKTADGTVDGRGTVIGNASADHRNSSGYVLSGPEFLTMFDGRSGAAVSTVDYIPPRGNVSSWGDSYGNRVDRFLAGTAYLDGARPSVIMARGYYTRAVVAAWDFRNGRLVHRWTADSNASGMSRLAGQGSHNLTVGDVDEDGRDEIVYGAAAIDDDGSLLWSTGTGHGDAAHLGDLDPSTPGLEYYKVSESGSQPASLFIQARTGAIRWRTSPDGDNGRGVAGDIYAGNRGAEMWSSADSSFRTVSGSTGSRKPGSANFLLWWDGDPVRELLDGTAVSKYGTGGDTRVLSASGVATNNGTKSNVSISGDILGDWREEVVWRTSDNRALRIYTTGHPTTVRVPTLLHDPQYRVALAWQNTAYNQPPHPSFFIGDGMSAAPWPNITVPGGGTGTTTSSSTTTTTSTRSSTSSSGAGGIVGVGSAKCLDTAGGSQAPGAQVVINTCDGSATQQWALSGSGELRTANGQLCLDAAAQGTEPGTRLLAWECHGGANQQFAWGAGDSIRGTQSGLCVDVASRATADGSTVLLWTCSGASNQQWRQASGQSSSTSSSSGSTSSSSSSGNTGTGGCAASFEAANAWDGGFVGEVAVTAGGRAIDGWQVSLRLPSGTSITNAWGGRLTGSSGTVTVANESYNGGLGAGQSTVFGFQATGSPSGITVSCSAG